MAERCALFQSPNSGFSSLCLEVSHYVSVLSSPLIPSNCCTCLPVFDLFVMCEEKWSWTSVRRRPSLGDCVTSHLVQLWSQSSDWKHKPLLSGTMVVFFFFSWVFGLLMAISVNPQMLAEFSSKHRGPAPTYPSRNKYFYRLLQPPSSTVSFNSSKIVIWMVLTWHTSCRKIGACFFPSGSRWMNLLTSVAGYIPRSFSTWTTPLSLRVLPLDYRHSVILNYNFFSDCHAWKKKKSFRGNVCVRTNSRFSSWLRW